MNSCKQSPRRALGLLASMLAFSGFLGAADETITKAVPAVPFIVAADAKSQSEQIAELRAALAAQQKLLDSQQKLLEALQQAIERQQTTVKSPEPTNLGKVASTARLIPSAPLNAVGSLLQKETIAGATTANPCEGPPDTETPAYLRLGSVCMIPIGFMDLTGVWRDKNAGSGIGTNFGSIPYNNTIPAQLTEFRFSPQNSRVGFRVDGDWKGAHFIGYNEFDFLGTSGSNNLGITNGAFVPRLRLFWVDIRKGKYEMLAGQNWSLLTPNRKGVSVLPGDLFLGHVIDVNYISGLTWTRQPGVRFLYHPNDKVAAGLSLENPDQYIGGSAGAPVVTLPAALTSLAGTQFDNATNVLTTPNLHPDIIGKIAFDPNSRVHFEVAGIERTFKLFDPLTGQHHTAVGGGAQVGLNVELVKNIRAVTSNYWSDGGGRYLFGQAPDVIIRADGSISPIHAGGTVDGIEATVKNTLLYAYYGGMYVGRNSAFDANGTSRIGYGYLGSANSQNRTEQEITFGFNQTIWKSPRYGALNYMMQYQYQLRNPWSLAAGAPKSAHDNAVYLNIRYTLPGGMPNF